MEHADAKARRDAGEKPSMYEAIGDLQPFYVILLCDPA